MLYNYLVFLYLFKRGYRPEYPDTRDPDARCTLTMNENRLKAFEDMLAANLAENCIPNKMTTMDDSYHDDFLVERYK